jgi:2-amino-4-hydroxy-6-hydroxymethyldihydropteridine diphosphokinase
MSSVVLGLGSNLGDRLANLSAAIDLLGEHGVRIVRQSAAWETEPEPPSQPRYLNAVVVAETELEPAELLAVAKDIERLLGRVPGPRWGPRPADIDILFYDARQIDEPELTVPHPRIAERSFVLAPLAEVMEGDLPVLGEPAGGLLEKLSGSAPVRAAALGRV